MNVPYNPPNAQTSQKPQPPNQTPSPAPHPGEASILRAPSVLIQGASGSGKTSSIVTLLRQGIEVFVIGTEPGFVDSLIDRCRDLKVPVDNLHWATALPATEGWDAMDSMVNEIGSKDFQAISALKGIGKEKTRVPAARLLSLLKDFLCERTGNQYGSFTTWGDNRALVVDSLSGLSTIAWYLTVGYKPTGAMGEWSIAMNFIESLLMKVNSDRRCYFVLLAHVEKELDEISGTQRIMTSTLGRKLAPKLARFFGEVVYAQRVKEVPNFRWSTLDNNADLKNRILPVSDKLEPDFKLIVEGHNRRKQLVQQGG